MGSDCFFIRYENDKQGECPRMNHMANTKKKNVTIVQKISIMTNGALSFL